MQFNSELLSAYSTKPPDPVEAEKVLEKYYIRKEEKQEDGYIKMVPFKMKDSIEKFKKFGEGTYMYFYLIKYFGFVFLILSLLMIFPTVYNSLNKTDTLLFQQNPFLSTMIVSMKTPKVRIFDLC